MDKKSWSRMITTASFAWTFIHWPPVVTRYHSLSCISQISLLFSHHRSFRLAYSHTSLPLLLQNQQTFLQTQTFVFRILPSSHFRNRIALLNTLVQWTPTVCHYLAAIYVTVSRSLILYQRPIGTYCLSLVTAI